MAIQSDHEFAPTQIARAVFPTAFRGYDQDAVRRYLSRLAAALEHQQEYAGLGELEARTPAHERVEELEAEVESLQDEIKDLELELVQRSVDGSDRPEAEPANEGVANDGATFDEHRAIELLGKETARVLESARSAASDILKRAETQAASLKAQAKSELAEARKRADSLLTTKQAETEEMVDRMLADAEASAQRVTTEADEHRTAVLEESSKILTEAEELSEAEQAEAEERAKQIVADAETLRQQVIAELVVERRDAQNELDRVATARDRLAMSLAVARSELDEVADALVDSGGQPGRESELDLDAEVDGLIESLETDAEPQESDLGIEDPSAAKPPAAKPPAEKPSVENPSAEKPSAKKKRNSKRSRKAGSAGKADSAADSSGVTKNGTSRESDESTKVEASKSHGAQTLVNADSDSESGTAPELAAESDLAAEVEVAAAPVESESQFESEYPTGVGVDAEAEPADQADDEVEVVLAVDEMDVDVQVININPAPAQGEELSLVEGFTTLDVGDLDLDMGDLAPAKALDDVDAPAASSKPRAGNSDRGATEHADRSDSEVIDLTADEHDPTDDGSSIAEPDEDDPGLVYSVLVNEPQSPDEVITTVASRTATVQRDRTRGDLLIEEAFTGRLPKPFAARDVTLTRSGPNFRRQLRRALNDDQSDVLDRLRAGRGPIKVEELPAFGDQTDRYLAPLRRGLAEIAQAGARAGGQSDLSQSALDNLVRQLAKYIVDKVRVPTIQVVEEASDQDRERILEPIRGLYRDFRNVGLPDLTEDALYESFAIGLYDAIEPAAPVRWITDPRSDPDPVCEINQAKDDVAKGEVFPSGHARPLSLPGCRCLVAVAKY